ncbi:MAG: hypothetical protein QN122_04075 [Armatimonadota bacterium]|nr:hypothetical protein [Armatimonadota bacterium]MDR7449683.1 hypothetical protein [Armatimonadota bacterium]MDR7458401.1 hypothetical protein [Armatimonadota bacterium]MDR7478796.1 hypothetical protein [Armatimonadota bacterium]MDR7488819.1 hypothetical protein [Armatimonadota bacterium]
MMTTNARPNGAAAAAILSAAIGVFLLGLLTTLAELLPGLKGGLTLWALAGPLSGKTAVSVGIWLVAWVALHRALRASDVNLARYTRWAWVLIVLGLVLTFPPMFEAFAR